MARVIPWAKLLSRKRSFLAIDGEGVTDPDGKHRYILLASSDHNSIGSNELSSEQCFNYLLGLPPAIIVGFSINYDICMWLKDVPKHHLRRLAMGRWIVWNHYRIKYTPGKEFFLKHRGRSVHIYDVFGFFQKSFVKTLVEWSVCSPEESEYIAGMKDSRATFQEDDLDEIARYCYRECDLLLILCDKLRDAMETGNINVSRWYGAGAIAAAILTANKVKQYIGPLPIEYQTPILSAYYGGRFEISTSGSWEDVHGYDIRSAYPHIARSLPCLVCADWRPILTDYNPAIDLALYHVRWNVSDTLWPPFPVRDKTGSIWYPLKGEGWYWSNEVNAAARRFGNSIAIIEGIELVRQCEHTPLNFIDDLYATRAAFRARKNYAHITLKLGINSLYGKFAQSVGHGSRKPPYQSFVWAALITAGCRAMISDAIAQDETAILSVATDGILSSHPLALDIGEGLGQWEYTHYPEVFLVQSGVYETVDDSGKRTQKTRGFSIKEIDFDAVKRAFDLDPIQGRYLYNVTRFVGLRSALMRRDFAQVFRRWIETERRINFHPPTRMIGSTERPIRHWPPTVAPVRMSVPYSPANAWSDVWQSLEQMELIDAEQP